MRDTLDYIIALRRPRLLTRAALLGLANYSRERTLARVLESYTACSERVLQDLIQTEAELEATRKTGDVGYSVSRHLEVLIALMGEARLLISRQVQTG